MEYTKPLISQQEWGIPGYSVAKTVNYITKSATTGKSPKSLPLCDQRTISFPDSTKYSPTLQKTQQIYWKPTNGKFCSAKKVNFLEEHANRNKSNPGPGAYLAPSHISSFNKTLGRFDKSERLSYLTTVESYAEEIPCSWTYETSPKQKINSLKWITPKIQKETEKQVVGPGKYEEVDLAKTLTSSPKFSFPKSKTPKTVRIGTPGVGSYLGAESGYFKCMAKKIRAAVILPYRIRGFTETVVKNAAGMPGPGSYNIGPPIAK